MFSFAEVQTKASAKKAVSYKLCTQKLSQLWRNFAIFYIYYAKQNTVHIKEITTEGFEVMSIMQLGLFNNPRDQHWEDNHCYIIKLPPNLIKEDMFWPSIVLTLFPFILSHKHE